MLFKILHGDDSRISTDITPFHEGYCYVTHSGYMYVDVNIGTIESPNNQRIKLNSANAETLCGISLDELKAEFATQSAVVLHEAQSYTDTALVTATTQDAVVLHEAQIYTDTAIAQVKESGGLKGEDGYTPVRGTDYWTDADKAEIKSYVDDAILNGAW